VEGYFVVFPADREDFTNNQQSGLSDADNGATRKLRNMPGKSCPTVEQMIGVKDIRDYRAE